jgi:hypothetical protein
MLLMTNISPGCGLVISSPAPDKNSDNQVTKKCPSQLAEARAFHGTRAHHLFITNELFYAELKRQVSYEIHSVTCSMVMVPISNLFFLR